MRQPDTEHGAHKNIATNKKLKPVVRSALTVAVGVGLFLAGWGVGTGRVSFGQPRQTAANKNLPSTLDYTSVNEAYGLLKANFDGKLDIAKLNAGLKEGLVKAADDPYTEYLDTEATKEFNDDLAGSFTGIGAELGKDKNSIVIVAPIAGFPAEKAGLKPKDVIVEIDGKSAYDLSVSDAVKRIRGPKDTVVKLRVVRGGSEDKTFEITRADINIPSVEAKIENGVGYLKISRFGQDTRQLATEAATNFKQSNVSGVVLDVRGDPGGLLDVAVDVAGLWLPRDKTVLTERRDGRTIKTYRARGSAPLAGVPTAVLINEGSASASEIVAGALKDNGAATLVGTKSFGKGSVQQLAHMEDGSTLKVTIARWYTPAGKNIDKAGIEPDKKVELTEEDAKAGRDPQKDAALAAIQR